MASKTNGSLTTAILLSQWEMYDGARDVRTCWRRRRGRLAKRIHKGRTRDTLLLQSQLIRKAENADVGLHTPISEDGDGRDIATRNSEQFGVGAYECCQLALGCEAAKLDVLRSWYPSD